MNNEKVVENWKLNKEGKSGNGNLRTDGNLLYSYNMLIGITKSDIKYSLDVTSPNFYSMTTSQHCGLAKKYSDKIIEPVHKSIGYNCWFNFPKKYLTNI